MLRLLICDDAPDAREAVKVSLAEQPEIEIVGEAENGEKAVAAAAYLHPDVILMDVKMPVVDGIVATKRIRDVLPRTRIVAYAGSDDTDDVMAMLEAGADAYCVKGAPLWELERALAGASEPLVRLGAFDRALVERRRHGRPRRAGARRAHRRVVRGDLSLVAGRLALTGGSGRPERAASRCTRRRTSSRARTRSFASSRRTRTSWVSSTDWVRLARRRSRLH